MKFGEKKRGKVRILKRGEKIIYRLNENKVLIQNFFTRKKK